MAAKFDLWRNSQIDVQLLTFGNNTPSRQIRQGIVTDIDLTSGSPEALHEAMRAVTAVVSPGESYSANQPGFLFSRIILTGASNDSAMAQLIYETPPISGMSTYVVTDDSVTQPYQTNYIPGTYEPIYSGYDDPDGNDSIPPDAVIFNVDRAVRRISVSTLQYGSSPPQYQSEVNKVNDAPWLGLGIGFWRVTSYSTSLSRYQGYFQTQAVAISKQDEDWSQMSILKNRQTQRYVPAPSSVISTIAGLSYSFGFIFDGITDDSTDNDTGLLRIGFYKTTGFPAIFGISDDSSTPPDTGDNPGLGNISL